MTDFLRNSNPHSLSTMNPKPVQQRSIRSNHGLRNLLAASLLSVPLFSGGSPVQAQVVDPAECAIRTLALGRFSSDQIAALCRGGNVDTATCASRALNTGRFNSLDQVVNLCRRL